MSRPLVPLALLAVACAAAPPAPPPPPPVVPGVASATTAAVATTPAKPAAPGVPRVVRGALTTELVPEVPRDTAQRLERYLNVRRADLAGWDVGGRGLYILTRLANVTQLHRVDMPLGMRRQLTFGAEGIDGFVASPDPKRPGGLIVADVGGDENAQLYTLDASGNQVMLTDGKSRNGAPVWSSDGARVAFHSTRRNGRDFDLWTLDPRDPKAPHQQVYEAQGMWSPLDWSPKGDKLLVLHQVSETKSALHVLEPGKGLVQQINPAPKPDMDVAFEGAVFGPGGAGVYYVSDAGGDLRALWYRDLASGKDTRVSGESKWDVESVVPSEDRALLAVTFNEGGWTKLRLFDTRTQKFRADPKLPPSIVLGLSFSRDGKRLALVMEGAPAVGDVHVLELAKGQLERWTDSEVGGLDPKTFHTPRLIEYPSFDGRSIPAFVIEPSTPGPHPVVVSIHGGPEAQSRPYFSSFYEYLVRELGIAVVIPNVRGSTGYGRAYTLLDNGDKREDSVKDIGALLDWIAKQPQLNAQKVAVYGGSYGGYMVLATGAMYPERVAAIVDVVGISNFVTFLESTKEYRRDLRRVEYGDERIPEMRAFLQRISPTQNVARIKAPLFVVQGANDPRVPVTEAEQIVRSVREQGREVWYMVAADEGHGFQKKDNRDAFIAATTMFLERHLLGKP